MQSFFDTLHDGVGPGAVVDDDVAFGAVDELLDVCGAAAGNGDNRVNV